MLLIKLKVWRHDLVKIMHLEDFAKMQNDVGKQVLAVDTSMFLGDVILETELSGEAVHCGDGRHLVPEPP